MSALAARSSGSIVSVVVVHAEVFQPSCRAKRVLPRSDTKDLIGDDQIPQAAAHDARRWFG